MAWTTPGTVAPGEVYTSSRYNTDTVENLIDLRSYQNRFGSYRYNAGNITLTGTTNWSNLPTIGTAGDITLNASDGDVIEAALYTVVGDQACEVAFDVVTVVGSTVTNSFGKDGAAPAAYVNFNTPGWWGNTGVISSITGSLCYTLVSGDISAGTVKLRVRYVTSSATNKTMFSSATSGFYWHAKNLGPVTT